MIIGITGGTGSGKSTLLRLIAEQGGLILDCDAIYHHLLQTDTHLLQAIENRFPGTVTDGILDRKKLGGIVFNDENALQELNVITHAAVKAEVLHQLEAKPSLAAIDAIGLFEGDLASVCDVTVAVTAPEELRLERIMARDGISAEQAKLRMAAQKDADYYAARCDHVFVNNAETPEELAREAEKYIKNLIKTIKEED